MIGAQEIRGSLGLSSCLFQAQSSRRPPPHASDTQEQWLGLKWKGRVLEGARVCVCVCV